MQEDEHLLNVCRYVERNALTAELVDRAQDWRWSSLWARDHGPPELKAILSPWPVHRPSNWIQHVNEAITAKELKWLRDCVARGQPFGSEAWTRRTANHLHLERTLRREGRPDNPKRKSDAKRIKN